MTTTLWAIGGYIVLQLVVAGWIFKRIATESDYFLAGRQLGLGIASFSIFATWFGAETCVGASAAVFANGLSGGRADPFGYALCIALMGAFFAAALWRKKLVTLGDLFRQRFSPRVETVAVLIMIPSSLFWAAAQIRAFGQIIAASSTFSVDTAIAAAALVVIGYTALGGLLADAITDVIQGIVLIAGLVLLAVVVFTHQPDPLALFAQLDPARWRLLAPGQESWWLSLESWMVPILGSLIAQELISRVLASRSAQIATRSCFVAAGAYLLMGLIPVTLGLIGPQLMGGLAEPEQFLPRLAQQYLPGMLGVVFVGALVSAILSTIDSALLAVGALVSHNLVMPRLPQATEATKVRVARGVVMGAGLVAWWLATKSSSIYELVENSSSFGSAGILMITLFGTFTRFGGTSAALGSLAAGVLAMLVGEHMFQTNTPFLLSLLAAATTYVGVGAWEAVREWRTVPDFAAVAEEAEMTG